MKGRKRLRMCILYKNITETTPVEGSCLRKERRWSPWPAELECPGDQGLGGGLLLEIHAALGDVGSKGMGGHPHDTAEGLDAFMHVKDEAWSHQRAQGLGRLEAKHINWGWVQQGGFYEGIVCTVYFNLNPSEWAPCSFHCVDWKRASSKAVT